MVSQTLSILVVDDELNITEMLREFFLKENWSVEVAHSGKEALNALHHRAFDVVILDVMLPEMNGIEVCRIMRQFSNAYVIMLTARTEEIDRIIGLSVGADDYVVKPFSPRELVARIKAMLRRLHATLDDAHQTPEEKSIRIGDLMIDPDQHSASLHNVDIQLTAKEFDVLYLFMQHPGKVFTRSQLLDRIWGNEYYDEHVVDVHMANIRKKIEPDSVHPLYIETVRGVGYRFRKQEG